MKTPLPVTENRYTCSHCSKSFEAVRRARYCSAACKQSAYRQRHNSGVTLSDELSQLAAKYAHLADGREAFVDDVTYPGYRRRDLGSDVLSSKYRDIAFQLTGHATNEGCSGIFAVVPDEQRELILLLILQELLEGMERPTGGSIHQLRP